MLKHTRLVVVLFILAALLLATGSPAFEVSAAPPALGVSPILVAAASYSVLAGSTVTNTGPTTVSGDLGVSPGAAVTGFPPGIVGPPGTIHAGDAHAAAAQADNIVAFGSLDQTCDFTYPDGQDLTAASPLAPGVHCSLGSFTLSANLTLTGSGVWIFKSDSTLITSPGSSITGGDACNVWWRVGSSATLGTNTAFTGNILALTSITMNTGASLNGRALAQTGAVTLDSNIVDLTCGALGVFLLSFTAQPDNNAIRLDWETASELNNVGFNVYRGASADGTDRELLDFVPSQGPGSNQGFSYRYDDTDVEVGQTYWYWLEDIDQNGATTLHGPVSATVNAPTAVGLTSLDASTAAAPAFSLVLLGLVGVTILAVWRRKRNVTVGLGKPPVI